MKVKVLPPSLADKIAAGEVVERPASVVKELVENSLDAGAQNISVEIKRGGVTFIRVTDDGCGMRPKDAKTAFLRHATSKISEVEDLNNIATYGFRGEALAAISAVSKVELITSVDSAATAYYLTLEGGEVTQEDEIGAPVGTSIIVRDLFYNTPARLHFLKKDSTEAAAVTTMMERLAIGRFDVSFTLISDQKVVFRTTKSDDMKNAIHAIYGSNISDYLMKVDFAHKNFTIAGYACKPNVMRSNRNMQLTFLNGRFVKSKILYHGIDEAYRSSRETGKQPVCFLRYTVDPHEVDVNVHPAKLEVKFRDDSAAIVLTKYGVMDALESDIPFYDLNNPTVPIYPSELYSGSDWQKKVYKDRNPAPSAVRLGNPFAKKDQYPAHLSYEIAITPEAIDTYSIKTETDDSFSAKFVSATIPSSANEAYLASSPMPGAIRSNFEDSVAAIPPNMKVLGELFKVYAVIEFQDTLYLVDKHAAHEKLIYNRLIEQVQENNNIASQSLLEPIVVVLPADDLDVVLNNAVLFYTAGFDFYESGPDRVSLTSAPSILPGESYTEAFVDLLEMIRKNKSGVTDRQDQALKTIACRSAIKGGSDCTIQELLPLISKIITEKDVGYCPHGRPVIQSLTHKEIDKMFKRIK